MTTASKPNLNTAQVFTNEHAPCAWPAWADQDWAGALSSGWQAEQALIMWWYVPGKTADKGERSWRQPWLRKGCQIKCSLNWDLKKKTRGSQKRGEGEEERRGWSRVGDWCERQEKRWNKIIYNLWFLIFFLRKNRFGVRNFYKIWY